MAGRHGPPHRASSTSTTRPNERVIAIDKANGDYKGQFRLAGSQPGWEDLRGDGRDHRRSTPRPDTLTWLSKDGVQQATLEAVPDVIPVATPIAIGIRRPGQDPQADEEALTVAAS